jgi:hypothetical protein
MAELRSIKGKVVNIKFSFPSNTYNIRTLLHQYKDTIISTILKEASLLHNSIKWYLAARVSFKKLINTETVNCTAVFRSRTQTKLLHDDIDEQYSTSSEKVFECVEKYTRDGSGWVEDGVQSLEVNIIKYKPLVGSSFLPTPLNLRKTEGIINVKNIYDEKCFLWCVLAALRSIAKDPQRVSESRPLQISHATVADVLKTEFAFWK